MNILGSLQNNLFLKIYSGLTWCSYFGGQWIDSNMAFRFQSKLSQENTNNSQYSSFLDNMDLLLWTNCISPFDYPGILQEGQEIYTPEGTN